MRLWKLVGTDMMARWYVYTLIDPRCGSVFYVGKGCGSRIEQHEKDARFKDASTKKLNKIRSIWADGAEIEKAKVAYFWEEQDAYDHETDLIASFGLANLTNIHPGGQRAFDRRLVERKEREERETPLHVALAKSPKDFLQRFAEWFKAGGHTGKQWSITAKDPAFRFHAQISEAVYNKILPMFWGKIQADEKSFEVLSRRLREFGVEFV